MHVTDRISFLSYSSGMKDTALLLAIIGMVSLVLVRSARADTSLTLIVTNIPSGWGTANGDSVAVIGTMNGWSLGTAATVQNNTLHFEFASIDTTALGSDWSDLPAGANLGFRFVSPTDASTTLIKADFRSNDGNFRLALVSGAGNTVVIDAAPIRTLVDQDSCVWVNGARQREYVRIPRDRFAFPGGLWKALVMSYDDGHDQDRGLIPIFNQYGIKGTFHLNSSWLDTSTFVSSEDVRTIYAPHEVSVHTVSHPDLTYVSDETIRWEVGHCRWALSELTGYDTCSMSYPMGGYDNRVLAQLPGQGVTCSRTVENTFSLGYLPVNPLKWHPTCHHANASAFADEFIARAQEEMALLFIWGHSYELDNGYSDNSWTYMSALCQKLGHRGDTWYAGMEEVRAYLAAIQALTYPSRNVIHNPSSSITVWAKPLDTLLRLAPGKTITYPAGRVVTTPAIPFEDTSLTLTYSPGTNALGSAEGIRLHIGHDGWQDTQDILLTRQPDGSCTGTYAIPSGARSLQWAFFDGGDVWDDNGGSDWSLAVRAAATGTPATIDLVAGSPAISGTHAGQNAAGETVDFNTDGRFLAATVQGGFGNPGRIYANYDATNLYLGGSGMNPGGTNHAVILFLQISTLPNPASNLWDFTGTPYSLDQLHNVAFNPAVNLAILLGDEYGDGNFMHFNLESGADLGQGAFYIDSAAKRFLPIPGVRLSQFDGSTNTPTASSDDDGNRQTDRWEIAIPWSSLNAPMGAAAIGALHLSGLIVSDATSGNDRYISANHLGENAVGTIDAFGNYGFNFVTLSGKRIGLANADSDLDEMTDVEEYIAGTDPTNNASIFQALENRPSDFPTLGKILRWNGVDGRLYSVEATTNLLGTWTRLAADLPPTGVWTDTVHNLDERVYYRLSVRKP